MKTGLTLQELAAKITAQQELKYDLIAPTNLCHTVVDTDGKVQIEAAKGDKFPLLPTAHDQLGSHLQIPAKYYDRMLAQEPELLSRNVNTWLAKAPNEEKRMLRTLGGDCRAFLSNRYQRIDNGQIAEVVLPVLADLPGVQIVSSEVTEKRLYIQAVLPRVQGEVALNDVVQAGVAISNSEIGYGTASVSSLAWRLRCLNGMVLSDKFRAYHVGRRVDDSEALWAQDTVKADDRAVLLKIRDMVRAAVDEAVFLERVARMKEMTGVSFATTASVERGVEVLAKKVGANETERGGILASLIRGGDLSAWGVINAVTAQAHTAESYDRAVEFETLGGKLLELPKAEWKEVLEAA